jgi:hypothetical protein
MTVGPFFEPVAQLRTELFVVVERHDHFVHFNRTALHSNLKLFEPALVPSYIDAIMVASEINLLTSQQLPMPAALGCEG